MSELKTPTISGLVEKLYDENYIEDKEKDTVQAILEQSTSGMEKDDVILLITRLNAKLEARSSDLITQNRLNYASFDDAIKTSTREIKKEKAERQKSQVEATVEPLQDKKDIEKTPQEQAEIERQQRIAYNKEFVNNIFKDIPGLEGVEIPEEIKEEIAEDVEKLEAYYNEREQSSQNANGENYKEIKNGEEEKKCPINPEILEDVQITLFAKKVQQDMEANPNQTISNAIKNVRKNNKQLCKDIEKTGIIEEMMGAGMVLVTRVKNATVNLTTRKLQNCIDDTIAAINRSERENIIPICRLKDEINKRERYKKLLKKFSRIKENSEPQKEELNIFFEQLTQTYLSSNTSISILYDELSEDEIVKKFDLDFDDFVEGIKTNLFRDTKDDPIRENELADMLRAEREIRKFDIFNDSLKTSEENGFLPNESDQKDLEKQRNLEDIERRAAKYLKEKWAKRRSINVIEKSPPKKQRTKIKRESRVSAKEIEQQIKKISNDRKQIVEIAKEFGISTDEAAKKYFTENPETLKSYSKRERAILTRDKNVEEEHFKSNRILNKLNHFRKVRNNQLISIYTADIVVLSKKIEELEDGIDNPRELDNELQKLEKVRIKLKKAQKLKEKLEKNSKSKAAIDVIDRRVKKNTEKEIFLKYLESGKSAVEMLADIEASGNEHGFNKEDMIRIIEVGARKYLQQGSELNSLLENEKKLFDKENSLTALKIKKENAEKKGLDDWITPYKKKIAELEADQERYKKINEEYKNKILIRMGLNPNEIKRTNDTIQTAENGQVAGTEERKTNSGAEVVQEHKGQTGEIKKGLAVEELEVTGVKPNVKAIAKKNKVTPKRIKDAFSKIVGLRKSKEKEAEQNEAEVNPDEKTTSTNSEGIR